MRPKSRHRLAPAGIAFIAVCGPAAAQRADENAVTAAADAFGTSIGFQSVGLYSPNDARGFSPQQAGNLRIEGLYYDQQTWNSGDCMVRETTMRVGVAAQSYSFPAPTGIADITLRSPGTEAISSAVVARGPFGTAGVDVETQLPLVGSALGVDLCGGYRRDFAVDMFHTSSGVIFGATFRWQPTEGTEVIPFWSYDGGGGRQIVPAVYTDGTLPLPLFRTQDLSAQDWSTVNWNQTIFGVVVKSHISDAWQFAGGVFHSRERDPAGEQPYLTLEAGGAADTVLDLARPFNADSTSGELRLSRLFIDGTHRHELQFAVRGRAVDRDFGGDAITDFGTIDFEHQTPLPQPSTPFEPQNLDSTRQVDVGLTYSEHWAGWGSLGIGILSDHYRRDVRLAPATMDVDRTSPRLLNVRLESERSRPLVVYGSFVQGLEDSALAPVSAVNRNEPPPATRTWQVDGGIRWASDWSTAEKLQLLLGAFDIHKPYFNSDAANVYTQLGRVEHRGLETSVSYSNAGLTVLAGGVLLKSRVERQIPEPGATGTIPLGPVPLTLTANVDYAPPRFGPWAASLQWNRLSPRVATTDNSIYLPALATLGAGVRYRWTRFARPWTARLDGFNLTNARGLHVSSLDVVLPEQARRYALTVATDF